MRKLFFVSLVAMAATFASCNKIETAAPSVDVVGLSFNVADPVPDTKAIKTSWEEGDEILIMFYGKRVNGQQAKLKYVSGEWTVVLMPSELSVPVGRDILYYPIHFPGTMSYDQSSDNQLGYVGGNVRLKSLGIQSGKVTADGVLPLGTIVLDEKLNDDEYQVVVPGISAETPYTLSVTTNGNVNTKNVPANFSCAYAIRHYPFFNNYGTAITFGGGRAQIQGVANADGVAFTCSYYNATPNETDPYKYVFCLYDGVNKYYYTIAKDSDKTIAAGKAIKLPAFDGNGAQTYWKTSL